MLGRAAPRAAAPISASRIALRNESLDLMRVLTCGTSEPPSIAEPIVDAVVLQRRRRRLLIVEVRAPIDVEMQPGRRVPQHAEPGARDSRLRRGRQPVVLVP